MSFYVFRIVYLVSGVWWLIYSLDIAVENLIISVTIVDLLMALMVV